MTNCYIYLKCLLALAFLLISKQVKGDNYVCVSGSIVADSVHGSSSADVISAQHLAHLLGHLVGVKPNTEGLDFIQHITKMTSGSRPNPTIIFIGESTVHTSADEFLHSKSGLCNRIMDFQTSCHSKNCLAEYLEMRPNYGLPHTTFSVNDKIGMILFGELAQNEDVINQIYERSLSALQNKGIPTTDTVNCSTKPGSNHIEIPHNLNNIVSIVQDKQHITLQLLVDTERSNVKNNVQFHIDDECAKLLMVEIEMLSNNLEICMVNHSTKPKMCILITSLAQDCFRRKHPQQTEALDFAEVVFENLIKQALEIEGQKAFFVGVFIDKNQLPEVTLLKEYQKYHVSHKTQEKYTKERNQELQRRLEEAAEEPVTPKPTDEEQEMSDITGFQIKLWLSVFIIVALIWTFCETLAMTDIKDPMLFTKVSTAPQ